MVRHSSSAYAEFVVRAVAIELTNYECVQESFERKIGPPDSLCMQSLTQNKRNGY